MYIRSAFFLLGAGSLILTPSCVITDNQEEKPNFIIIQMDDLGYSDLGIHGNKLIETPQLDKFAENAIQFHNFYVNPVCAPSRASLLTGRHFLKTGVSHVHGGKDHLSLEEKTFATILRQVGYSTGIWGKWHSGTADGYLPWQRGFDEAYKARLYKHRNSVGEYNGKYVETGKWADDAIVDYALDFIKRNKAKPFVAYLSFLTCHSPLDAPEEKIKKYMNKGLSRNLSTLYAMIDHADESLGRFFNVLDQMEISENTLIFFMSDNGPAIENAALTDKDREIRYVNNLRGHKGNIWENGVRSPLFVYQKGKYTGGFIREVADITDILPTMIELAGLDMDSLNIDFDGISLVGLLDDEGETRNKVSFNYANPGWPPTDQPWTPEGVKDEYRPILPEKKDSLNLETQIISVRKGNYKLLQNPAPYPGSPEDDDSFVLINIEQDPQESNNILANNEEIFRDMKILLHDWFREIKLSDNSFAMPVFQLSPDKESIILAKAPYYISEELRNAYNYLGNWQQGSKASYSIYSGNDTRVKIKLEFKGSKPENTLFSVSLNNRERVLFDPEEEVSEPLFIPEGNFLFTISCEKTESPGFALDRIILLPSFQLSASSLITEDQNSGYQQFKR
jgi:arylsulfatase A-like enzyme